MSEYVRHQALEGHYSEHVIVALLPWAAEESNSAKRYDALAEASGIDVLTLSASGTGRVIIDRATRRALRAGNTADLVLRDAEFIGSITQHHDEVICLADSARGYWGAAIQNTEIAPFSGVAIRDGFNVQPGLGRLKGLTRLLTKAGSTGRVSDMVVPKDVQTRRERSHSLASGLMEVYTHLDLMCGPAGSDEVMKLADQSARTPVLLVGLGEAIGGSLEQMRAFANTCAAKRAIIEGSAPFAFRAEETWGHAVLMDPVRSSRHIHELLGLGSA